MGSPVLCVIVRTGTTPGMASRGAAKGEIIAAMSSDEEDNGNAAEAMDVAQRVSIDEVGGEYP